MVMGFDRMRKTCECLSEDKGDRSGVDDSQCVHLCDARERRVTELEGKSSSRLTDEPRVKE